MRAFLAVEFPDAVRLALHRLQQELRRAEADVTWVEPPNIHLTMRFLGEISDAQCEQIRTMSRAVAARTAAITMGTSGLGAFPSTQAPRVVWVGIEQGTAELQQLASLLEEGCAAAGLPNADHPFAAHVTLFESQLSSAGPVYRLVEQFSFQK